MTASHDCYVKFWDINSGDIVRSINSYSKCFDMHISRSETNIGSGHKDGSIKVWDSKSKDQILKLEDAHSDPVACLRFTPEELYIVSTSRDDTIKVWDIRMRKMLHSFEHDIFKLGSHQNKLCVSPNGQYAVCGTKDGALIFFDIKKGECVDIIPD